MEEKIKANKFIKDCAKYLELNAKLKKHPTYEICNNYTYIHLYNGSILKLAKTLDNNIIIVREDETKLPYKLRMYEQGIEFIELIDSDKVYKYTNYPDDLITPDNIF